MEPYRMPEKLGVDAAHVAKVFADANVRIRASQGYLEMQRRWETLRQEQESERWRNDPLELKKRVIDPLFKK